MTAGRIQVKGNSLEFEITPGEFEITEFDIAGFDSTVLGSDSEIIRFSKKNAFLLPFISLITLSLLFLRAGELW